MPHADHTSGRRYDYQMIERIERAAPLRVPAARPWARRTTHARPAGSILAMSRGEIAGDVRLLEHDERERRATYEVLVANDTAFPLAAFAYAVETGRSRGTGHMTWNAMVVPPHSAIAVEIEIAIPRRGKPPRVVAEVHSEDAQLTLDSVQLLPRYSRTFVRRAAATAAAAAIAVGTLTAVAVTRPRVAALAAPPSVVAGSAFSVAYETAHAASGEYTVEAPDGLQVRRGPLPSGSGAFTLTLPPGPMPGGYDLHVVARGAFGSDERSMHLLATVPPQRPTVARPASVTIAQLGLATDTVAAGTPIAVNYRTPARTGTVRLIDEYGTVRAEALLSRTGKSMLVAPFVDADQDLRVVVTAERGGAHDEAEIPVRVLRTVPPPTDPAPAPLVAGAAVPGLAAMPGANGERAPQAFVAAGPIAIRRAAAIPHGPPISVSRTQGATAPIVVRILRYEPKMHVAVLGTSGEELEGADVTAGDAVVTLSSPRDLGTNHPAVVATYAHGNEQETIVRQITVRGRVGHVRSQTR